MTTIPPNGGRTARAESHQARAMAESFGAEAERYERTRPSYPPAMVEAILAATSGREVLDVGVGTGISARPFLDAGCRVIGVEPDERMAQMARRIGLAVEITTFEQWDPAGRTFDLVTSGQAWHWVDPVAGAAKAAEALRPGGRVALFWNAPAFPPDLSEGFSAVYRRVLPEFPFFQTGAPTGAVSYAPLSDKAADGLRHAGTFSEPERWHFDWGRSCTTAEWLDAVPTFGGHSRLPPDKLADLLEGIGAVIDAAGGSIDVGYTAIVVTAMRTSTP